jgi:hypothetical protein
MGMIDNKSLPGLEGSLDECPKTTVIASITNIVWSFANVGQRFTASIILRGITVVSEGVVLEEIWHGVVKVIALTRP